MDDVSNQAKGGRLQISIEAIEKIARHATMEIEGVGAIKGLAFGSKSLLEKLGPPKGIEVNINNDVADIEIPLTVKYGVIIPELSEQIQQNVKGSIQNMTGITVGRVDIVITGVSAEENIA